jgi:NAD(P)-dependent dehydrogenase (short-subunit alcohol dehydrogenase family)
VNLDGATIVVTGGASGIGRALCQRFAREDARGIVVADVDGEGAAAVASEVGGLAVTTDVSVEADVVHLVSKANEAFGGIDQLCANAREATMGDATATDEDWQRTWSINVMAHVYAARALLPDWLERGHGYLLHTASAAGLLTQLGSAPYSVT